MSLTNFIKQPEIATKLRRLHVELVGERKADECAHEDAPATTIALRGKSYRVVRRVKTDEGKARYKAAKITKPTVSASLLRSKHVAKTPILLAQHLTIFYGSSFSAAPHTRYRNHG